MATDYLVASKWMIENVIEALDALNEWFFDEAAGKLTIPNSTDPDMLSLAGRLLDEKYVAVVLETLISINGTKAPSEGYHRTGYHFPRRCRYYHGALGRPERWRLGPVPGGAIFIEGAEEITSSTTRSLG